MGKKVIIIICLVVAIGIVVAVYSLLQKNDGCLGENEVAEYKIEKKTDGSGFAKISVKNKETNKEISNFQINIINPNHYHPIEIHKCYVYAPRDFNYDFENKKPLLNYQAEIWRYSFGGEGEKLIILGNMSNGNYNLIFTDDFRVSPNEKHLVLEKGYLGQADYSLVIKDLKTTNDLFTLKFNNIIKEHPEMLGTFGMIKWTDDNRYFWADIFDGAYTKEYIRINSQNWSYEIFELPNDMDIGVSGPLNFNTGYTILYPGLVWTGVVEMDEQIKEEWRKEGQQSKMYLYNIFTKQRKLLATTTEPLYDFNAQWLSDTELQYEMPNGEKRIYQIK